MSQVVALLFSLLLALPVLAAKDDNKGRGAGGVRDEHASEQGLEQGKAWSGSQEQKPAEADEDNGKGKPEKKDKKNK